MARRAAPPCSAKGSNFAKSFTMKVQSGTFWPDEDNEQARAFVVLGAKVRQELFAGENPLGQYLRVGGQRYRVVGVMEPKGQVLGLDLDDAVFIPAARAMELLNRPGLMEVQVSYRGGADVDAVIHLITERLKERHGREDFTIISQEQALEVLGSVLDVITFAVGALGGISLLVGAVGILTIMTMAVTERTAEIGLLRALGAQEKQVLMLFLGEAIMLSALGGVMGLVIGIGIAQGLHLAVPGTTRAYTVVVRGAGRVDRSQHRSCGGGRACPACGTARSGRGVACRVSRATSSAMSSITTATSVCAGAWHGSWRTSTV